MYICKTNGATSGAPVEVRAGTLSDISTAELPNWRQANIINPALDAFTIRITPEFAIKPNGAVDMTWSTAAVSDVWRKQQLKKYAAERRWNQLQGGTTFAGMTVTTDDASLNKINGALTALERGALASVRWKTAGGEWVTLSLANMRSLFDAVAAFIQACYDAEEAVDVLIDNGTYLTHEQIDGHAWP